MSRKQLIKNIGIGVFGLTVLASGTVYASQQLEVSQQQYQQLEQEKQQQLQQQLAEKVIRFHVLANSDSEEDQELKLMVRDAIGSYMQDKMPAVENKEDCEELITAWIPEIEQVAEKVIAEEGYTYPVEASLTDCDFPVKTYGEYTFPAGTYEALRVTIGEGEGANWWCVMYPNMCFENSMYEVVDENAEKALREVLDEEEYEAVLASGEYEIRFRFLEWFR